MANRFIPDAEFERRGYKPFDPSGLKYANHAWQKRFMNGETTLYFLNFYQYRESLHSRPSTSAEGVFFPPDCGESWVTVEMHYCGDLDFAEEFFSDVYHKLGMIPDKHNQ